MVEISPFRGYLYDKSRVKDMSSVIAPPWDVIDSSREQSLRALSPWNIVNIISQNTPPEEASALFKSWLSSGVLSRDSSECFYFSSHTFEYGGRTFQRNGVFALLRIQPLDSGGVIPHEQVFPMYRNNRYRLIEECRANFSPVFMLCSGLEDGLGKITGSYAPVFSGDINGEGAFALGRVTGREDILQIKKMLSEGRLIIADGHHRYQAALQYYGDYPEESNSRVMVFIADIDSEGLLILPTHRYVDADVSFVRNMPLFEKYFHVRNMPSASSMFGFMRQGVPDRNVFGVYESGRFYSIEPRSPEAIERFLPANASPDWRFLDTVVLHNAVFARMEGMSDKNKHTVFFHNSHDYLLDEYGKRGRGVIFFVNPVSKDKFRTICLNGELMPQKTTYFYPKVPSGLVVNVF